MAVRKPGFNLVLSFLLILSAGLSLSFGQVASTISPGNWDDPAIWSGGLVPNSSFGTVTVRHTVHVRSSIYPIATPLVIDQTTVGANGFTGYLIVDAGAYVRLNNGAGNDLVFAGVPTVGKVDVSGRLIASTGIAITGATVANFNFLSGATYEHQQTAVASALPTATYNVNSTVLINGFVAGGNIASASWSVPLGNVIFDCPGMGAGTLDFGGHLSSILGDFTIQNSGTTGSVVLKSTAASTGASTINIGGNLNVTGISRFFLATTAAGIQVNVAKDFNFNPAAGAGTSQNVTTGSSTLQVSGKVFMLSGTWNFASGNNGVGTIDLKGSDFNDTGATILTTSGAGTANGNINFSSGSTSQNINIDPTAIGAGTINSTINNTFSTPAVKLLRSLTISALNLVNGKLVLNGLSLTVNGAVSQTTGSLDATIPSTLIFAGAGTFPATPLNISATSSFTDLRLNRAAQTLRTSANFSVTTLDLFAGAYNNTVNTPQMANGGTVNRQATTAANTGVLQNALSAAGTYSVNYTNNVALTTGPELPAGATALNNLTKAGTNTLTVNQTVTINGDLTVSTGTFTLANAQSITLVGNYTNNATSNLGNTASSFTFASGNPATAILSGTTAPSFQGPITFSDNVDITTGLSIFRNLTVGAGASVNATAGTASFAGTTVVSNSGTLNLNAVTILASSSLTAPASTMGVAGNFTFTNATSTFTNNNGTILFNGVSSLLGTGTETFKNMSVAGTKSVASALAVTINGDITNNGTINFTAGTLTFAGATTISGAGTTTFSAATINSASSVIANAPFKTTGALTLNGTASLTANAPITATAAVAVNGTSNFTNNSVVNFSAAFSVAGTYTSTGSSSFVGATTMTGAGAKTMKDIAITGSLTPNSAYTITGNLALNGTGVLNAGNNTTTFGGATTISNSGTGTITFNLPTIAAGKSVNSTANIIISGTSFTGTGNFSSNANTKFSRAGATILTGAGAKAFGTVTINSGTTLTPNAAYTIDGNLVVNGTLGAGNSTTTFGGATVISTTGAATIGFNNIAVAAGKSMASVLSMTVNKDITNAGTINLTAGTLTFAGSSIISGAGTTNFNAATVNTAIIVTASAPFKTAGALTLNGTSTLIANAQLTAVGAVAINATSKITGNANVSFAGALSVAGTYSSTATTIFAGATTMTGAGTKTMKDISITGALTPNSVYTINGNMALSGTGVLNAGNSTTTFAGTTAISNSGSGTVTFNLLTINAGSSVSPTTDIIISGATFTGNGNYVSSAKTTFSRAGATTLTGAGAKTFGAVTINAGATLTPNAAYAVNGNLIVNGILGAGNNTATFGGITAITSTGAPTIGFNNLAINAASSLISYSGTITVNGNFTNNGTFTHNGGRVTFAGATTKNITSATPTSVTGFFNITVSNGAATPDVSVESGVDLFGVLTLAANAVVDADGAANNIIFTVRSTSDSPTLDAAIATLPAGANVTGNVTVQRYIAIEGANNRIYRYISSPVLNPAASDLQNEIPITGTFTGHSACSGCTTNQSMFSYDETVLTGGINGGYTNFPLASNAETLVKGRGYIVFVRGNINPVLSAGNARFDLRGPINSGATNYGVTYTSSGVPANDGWNLVGNPYPSTIDWNAAAGWTKANVGASIYLTDNGSNPTRVATWNGVVGTNGGSRYIAMGQGFFVQTNAAAPALTSNESVKVAGTQTTYFRTAAPTNLLRMTLVQGTMQDEAIIHFRDSASTDFDFGFDALKLKNLKNGTTPFLNLSSLSTDKKLLAINSMPALGCSNAIGINVSDVPQGSYQLNFSNLESFSSFGTMTLVDHFTSPATVVDLRQTGNYNFQVTSDTMSFGSNRFQINFANQQIPNPLSLTTSDVCKGTNGLIAVNNSQSGMVYYAKMNGAQIGSPLVSEGGTLNLTIASDSLKTGVNAVEVWAQSPFCSTAAINQTVSINVDSVYAAKRISSTTACQNGPVTLVAAGAPAEGHYNWYASPNDSIPLVGQVSETLLTPSLKMTTLYRVAAVNSLGCEGPRANIPAVVVNYADPEITEKGENVLLSNFANDNHWYLDGALLSDTTATLAMKASGLYRLEVKIQTCTTFVEREFSVSTVTATEQEITTIKAYPNPVAGILSLEIPDAQDLIKEAPVINTLGAQVGMIVLTKEGNGKKGEFDFTSMPQGFYFILVEAGNERKVVKIIRK